MTTGLIGGMSPKAQRFVEHNKDYAIIESAWLDKNQKEPKGGPETWVNIRSRFEDGTTLVLSDGEHQELLDANIKPRWKGFAA